MAPSAPSLPKSYGQRYSRHSHKDESEGYGNGQQEPPPPPPPPPPSSSSWSPSCPSCGHSAFPPETDPAVISSFQMVDSDMSGYIDENELQRALSSGYQTFSLGTIRLLIFLFKSPNDPLRVGPKQFAALLVNGECGMIVKGLTDKFKKNDPLYIGSATFSHDTFMAMVIPFLVSYN